MGLPAFSGHPVKIILIKSEKRQIWYCLKQGLESLRLQSGNYSEYKTSYKNLLEPFVWQALSFSLHPYLVSAIAMEKQNTTYQLDLFQVSMHLRTYMLKAHLVQASPVTVHALKKLMEERQFARAPSFARVIALTYLDLHARCKICVCEEECLVAEACQIFHLG